MAAQTPPGNAFGEAVVHESKAADCKILPISSTRAPDNRTISLLPSKNQFLAVDRLAGVMTANAKCSFDLVFTPKLTRPESIAISLRGAEFKDAATRLRYSIAFGKQVHHFEFDGGQILDGSAQLRRFLVNIPAGTRRLTVKFDGDAKSMGARAAARIDIDSFDICFVNAENPVECASASQPK